MSNLLHDAKLCASWQLAVRHSMAGRLNLYESRVGYIWAWQDKPAHLVSLIGVLDSVTANPWRFEDMGSAVDHLMYCTGVAFTGDCGLLAQESHREALAA